MVRGRKRWTTSSPRDAPSVPRAASPGCHNQRAAAAAAALRAGHARPPVRGAVPRLPGRSWAISFQFDSDWRGRAFTVCDVRDESTHLRLAFRVERHLGAADVVEMLDLAVLAHGAYRAGNGPEFIARAPTTIPTAPLERPRSGLRPRSSSEQRLPLNQERPAAPTSGWDRGASRGGSAGI